MPQQPAIPPIEKSSVLVVEGEQDRFFFEAFIRNLSLENIQVLGIGGKTTLSSRLITLAQRSGFSDTVTSLGIVRDADDNPKGAFQSVCSALKAAELSVPRRPLSTVGSTPRVTVMILPDANSTGMLEDVCLKAVENETAMSCVNEFFECLLQQGLSLPKNASKARIQVYLAALEAELRLGEAAQKGLWTWSHPAFDEIKAFLRQIASS